MTDLVLIYISSLPLYSLLPIFKIHSANLTEKKNPKSQLLILNYLVTNTEIAHQQRNSRDRKKKMALVHEINMFQFGNGSFLSH